MLFNSLSFAIFLPIIFVLYWFASKKKLKVQNFLLLAASYYFYASWDWRFLFLLIFSALLDFYTGIKMSESKNHKTKTFWFWLSVGINLGFLGLFKYYNFFADSFAQSLSEFGLQVNPWSLKVILPVGISFYTFHGLSYVIDIYKDRIKPERNFINYSLFVSFFPLLVAGPIERATHLLPQIKKERAFDYTKAVDGLRQILWGLFKKVVIADQCAEFVNTVFADPTGLSSGVLILGLMLFAIQVYGDFSGYSDIAIGTARLFGIDLLQNFSYPYFSRSIAEFWRRWHISLSTWFRDYLYIPLGGSRAGKWIQVRNILIVFTLCGFWHGANWTYLLWGFLNGLYLLPSVLLHSNRKNQDTVAHGRYLPNLKELTGMATTFGLIAISMVLFRSNNLSDSIQYVSDIFTGSFFVKPEILPVKLFILLIIFFTIEWLGREEKFAIAKLGLNFPRVVKWSFYYILVFSIFYYSGSGIQFVYFQF